MAVLLLQYIRLQLNGGLLLFLLFILPIVQELLFVYRNVPDLFGALFLLGFFYIVTVIGMLIGGPIIGMPFRRIYPDVEGAYVKLAGKAEKYQEWGKHASDFVGAAIMYAIFQTIFYIYTVGDLLF